MPKYTILLLTVCLFLLPILPARAQDASRSNTTQLSYDETITGTLTDSTFEVLYSFEGRADDIIVVELFATEEDSELDEPELVVMDGDNRTLFSTVDAFSYQEAILAGKLPYTGRYKLLVTRGDGRLGESTGDYNLRLVRARTLIPQETLTDTASNNQPLHYYAVEQTGSFNVFYEFTDGDLNLYIEAYRLDEGELIRAASLNGRELQGGSIRLIGNDGDIFIFTVGDSPYAYYFDDRVEQADYSLRLALNR